MGVLGPDQYEAELDFDIGARYDLMGLGTACPIICDEDTDMVSVARNIARFFRNESCGKCTPCREGTPRMVQVLDRLASGSGSTTDLDELRYLAEIVGAASLCGLGQMSGGPINSALHFFGEELGKLAE